MSKSFLLLYFYSMRISSQMLIEGSLGLAPKVKQLVGKCKWDSLYLTHYFQ